MLSRRMRRGYVLGVVNVPVGRKPIKDMDGLLDNLDAVLSDNAMQIRLGKRFPLVLMVARDCPVCPHHDGGNGGLGLAGAARVMSGGRDPACPGCGAGR